jgi:hypothetical protein
MIKSLENRLDILEFIDWIKETPLADDTHARVLGRYLSGFYQGIVGYDEANNPKGLMIYYISNTDTLFIVLLYARGQVNKFLEEFVELCKKRGIKRVRGNSIHGAEIFRKIPGVKQIYSVYEKEI